MNKDTLLKSVLTPQEEHDRQMYFIEKAKEYVKKKKEEIGRPLFFKIVTFGCEMHSKPKILQMP